MNCLNLLQVCQALLLSLSAVSLSLVCEEDGTEVDSDEFLITLPDNTMLMALEPGQTWRPQPVCFTPSTPFIYDLRLNFIRRISLTLPSRVPSC